MEGAKNRQCNDKQNSAIGGVVDGMRPRDYSAPAINGSQSGSKTPPKDGHVRRS